MADMLIRLYSNVRGLGGAFAAAGYHAPVMNHHGAVSVAMADGTTLGVMPKEMTWVRGRPPWWGLAPKAHRSLPAWCCWYQPGTLTCPTCGGSGYEPRDSDLKWTIDYGEIVPCWPIDVRGRKAPRTVPAGHVRIALGGTAPGSFLVVRDVEIFQDEASAGAARLAMPAFDTRAEYERVTREYERRQEELDCEAAEAGARVRRMAERDEQQRAAAALARNPF